MLEFFGICQQVGNRSYGWAIRPSPVVYLMNSNHRQDKNIQDKTKIGINKGGILKVNVWLLEKNIQIQTALYND